MSPLPRLVMALAAGLWCAGLGCAGGWIAVAEAEEEPAVAEIRAAGVQLAKALSAGQADAVAAMFLAQGELIDEHGQVYQGTQEIKDLLVAYFKKYPGATVKVDIESIRILGPVAVEEGTRVMATKDGQNTSQVRYVAVRSKTADGWRIASVRDFPDDPPPTPHELLQPLAWLAGDWINEGADAVVKISYRWSEDKNFLLGDFQISNAGDMNMKTSQRIGWDPVTGKVRSWFFDSDGGYGEGQWTQLDEGWLIKSSVVLPDGQTGSATITLTPQDNNRYSLKATDRVVGEMREDDFQVTVTRRPPTAGSAPAGTQPSRK